MGLSSSEIYRAIKDTQAWKHMSKEDVDEFWGPDASIVTLISIEGNKTNE